MAIIDGNEMNVNERIEKVYLELNKDINFLTKAQNTKVVQIKSDLII